MYVVVNSEVKIVEEQRFSRKFPFVLYDTSTQFSTREDMRWRVPNHKDTKRLHVRVMIEGVSRLGETSGLSTSLSRHAENSLRWHPDSIWDVNLSRSHGQTEGSAHHRNAIMVLVTPPWGIRRTRLLAYSSKPHLLGMGIDVGADNKRDEIEEWNPGLLRQKFLSKGQCNRR
jgi:hypothetical protein